MRTHLTFHNSYTLIVVQVAYRASCGELVVTFCSSLFWATGLVHPLRAHPQRIQPGGDTIFFKHCIRGASPNRSRAARGEDARGQHPVFGPNVFGQVLLPQHEQPRAAVARPDPFRHHSQLQGAGGRRAILSENTKWKIHCRQCCYKHSPGPPHIL